LLCNNNKLEAVFGGTGVNFINILRAHFRIKVLFLPKSFCQSQNVTREKLREALLYEKRARKMLMKLTPVKPFLHALLVLRFISLTQFWNDRIVSEAKNVRMQKNPEKQYSFYVKI